MSFPNNPTQGMIHTLTSNRKMIFDNGRWKLHLNTISPSAAPTVTLVPPLEASAAPEQPTDNPLLFDPASKALFIQSDVEGQKQWVEV